MLFTIISVSLSPASSTTVMVPVAAITIASATVIAIVAVVISAAVIIPSTVVAAATMVTVYLVTVGSIYRTLHHYPGSAIGIVVLAVAGSVHIATKVRTWFIDHYLISTVQIVAAITVRQFCSKDPVARIKVNKLSARNIIVGIDLR